MNEIEALILGIVQGLTEYLPVSSSGHLVVGSAFMDVKDPEDNLTFAILVHAATALSSVIIFRREIISIIRDLLKFSWNKGTQYTAMLMVSALPVIFVGLFFNDQLEAIFEGQIALVGGMWILTGLLLLATKFGKSHDKEPNFINTFIIGIAQAIAVLPGISRSGATIATALLLGVKREEAAKFSFLVVIAPILGKALLDLKDFFDKDPTTMSVGGGMEALPALIGFIAAFVTGLAACKAMVSIVKRGTLHWFSLYCAVIGVIALLIGTDIIKIG